MVPCKTTHSVPLVSRTPPPVNQDITVLMEPNMPLNLAVLMEHTVTSPILSRPVSALPVQEGSTVDRKDYRHPLATVMVAMCVYRELQQPHQQMAPLARSVMLGDTVQSGPTSPLCVLPAPTIQHKVRYMSTKQSYFLEKKFMSNFFPYID